MDMTRLNGEGYFDPTAYAALKRIEREKRRRINYRPRVYICSPFVEGATSEMENTKRFCRFAITEGYSPYTPHLFFPIILDSKTMTEHDLGVRMGLIFLDCCSQVWVFGDLLTDDMALEIDRARRYSKPIRFFTTDCKEASNGIA